MTAGTAGMVYFVGAGPGEPGLLTVRGTELLRAAELVLYDPPVNRALLELTPRDCVRVCTGAKPPGSGQTLSEQQCIERMISEACAGRQVVRLMAGDTLVRAPGVAEACALADAGVPFELVPGVSIGIAALAHAGIPLTASGLSASAAFAREQELQEAGSAPNWEALARAGTSVIYIDERAAGRCAQQLISAGGAPTTPAAVICGGATSAQRTMVATLGELAAGAGVVGLSQVESASAANPTDAGLQSPAVLVVGAVVQLRDQLSWYERRPLFGWRILVPRARQQAGRFAAALSALGGEPVCTPVTRLLPPVDPAALASAVLCLDSYSWVAFTSANAVIRLFDAMDAAGLDSRALGLARIACVGAATAAALAERGIRADCVPVAGDARATADAMIAAAAGELRQARVLLPRAERGREELAEVLRAAGAEVDLVLAYRTEVAPADDPAIARGLCLLRAGELQAAAFFAPSQVSALVQLLGPDAAACVNRCRVVAAIGNTTARALTERGIRVDLVPTRPDAQTLARDLAEARGN